MRDTFVSADWLAARLDDPGVRVVDVRDAWEYDGIGHVPGAVSIPFDAFRSSAGDAGMLPGADRWTELLSNAGVAPDDEIVAYDDEHGVFAARFLVTTGLYGHDPGKLHVLDGDYSSWSREHETERDAPATTPALAEAGIGPDRTVLLYCNTARRISHTYLALRHLGYEDVLFYEGSLSEWEERDGEIVSE